MILDAEAAPIPPAVSTEVAVVGAGPAGIALALEFSGRGFEVVVLESGGPIVEDPAQDLAEATMSGEPDYPLPVTRVRALGGTSVVWGGRCHPLEPADLAPREWVPGSGWPFGADELARWYPRAQELVEIGPEPFDIDHWRSGLEAGDVALIETERLRTMLFRVSPPTLFGERYRGALDDASDITVWLHAPVVNLVTTPDGSAVTSLEVVTMSGRRAGVDADVVVLATGGLEVPRLMLASRDVDPAGVGNRHDLVGRYFMEHPHIDIATLVLSERLGGFAGANLLYGIGTPVDGSVPILAHLALRPEVVVEERLVAGAALLGGVLGGDDDSGRLGAVEALLGDIEGGEPWLATLVLRAEQSPDPENRVTLGTDVDAVGMPRAHLHWKVGDADRRRYARMVKIIADDLGGAGLARLGSRIVEPDGFPAITGGHHHMGTARMHEDAGRGVVDPDGRVHGLDNLYVASSAVFPTSGVVNPTLTIVALAVRLAHHLVGGVP